MKKVKRFDSSLFIGPSYFFCDGAQLYLTFQRIFCTLKNLGSPETIVLWKFKGLSVKKLNTPSTTENLPSPSISWYANSNFCLVFKGSCLKQNNATYTSPKRIFFLLLMN